MGFINEARRQVVDYAQRLYIDKLVAGTSGNISIYDSDSGVVAITPTSEDYMQMTEDSIILIDMDGNTIEGAGKPSSEWPMHTELYKNRKDIKAVVHTHSPYATGFAVLGETIPVILLEMVPRLKGCIPVTELALPGTIDTAMVALRSLENHDVCLLRNHGVITVGCALEQAYTRAVYVEESAVIYNIAKTCGVPQLIPDDMISDMMKKYHL